MLQHFPELRQTNALNVCINAISRLVEQVPFKPGQVVLNALWSVQADFLHALQELLPPHRGRSTAAVCVGLARNNKPHIVVEHAEEPFPPALFEFEESKRTFPPELQLTSYPVIAQTAALLRLIVEPYAQFTFRTAEIAGMCAGTVSVLIGFNVNLRVRLRELADVPSSIRELADLDDIEKPLAVFLLVDIVIGNVKSGDVELLLVRGDLLEQLREALAAGGLELAAALTGHLHAYAHIIAVAVPHYPDPAVIVRLLVTVVTAHLNPAAAAAQTETLLDLIDRHIIVHGEGEPVHQDDIVLHFFQPPLSREREIFQPPIEPKAANFQLPNWKKFCVIFKIAVKRDSMRL